MPEYLICPICGKHVKNLISHIRRSHDNNIKTRKDLENRFPELKGTKIQISKYDMSKEYICEYCGKIYQRLNDLQNHIKNHHPEHYQKTIMTKCPQQTCPICGKELGNLRQHVRETHELKWEDFCIQYNWDPKKAKIITDEYRELLSKNKIKYYQSPEGQIRKKKQSEFWKNPDNNPVYDPKCLEKSMYSRSSSGNLGIRTQDCRGIKVQYCGMTFRSFTEFKFYILCKKYGFDLEYEPRNYCVKWYSSRKKFYTTYLPDFLINGKYLVELKQDKSQTNKSKQTEKYQKVTKIYKKLNIDYLITWPSEFFENHGLYLDYRDRQYIKETVLSLAEQEQIKIITPYRHSTELMDIFYTDDLSEASCITFTKNINHNMYGEL